MAKRDMTKLEAAKEELKKAEQAYDKLVNCDMSHLKEEQKQEHIQACREALNAKREAQKTVENAKKGV